MSAKPTKEKGDIHPDYIDSGPTIIISPEEQHKTERDAAAAAEASKRQVVIPTNQAEMIERMAQLARDLDLDKFKAIQEMFYNAQDREAKRLYDEAFVKMKADLPKVVRLKWNDQTKSWYAPLEDININVDKILERHGFGTSHNIISTSKDGVTVTTSLRHVAGHTETTGQIWMPVDDKGMAGGQNKTLIHGIKSAITYAERTGLCALLNISTGDPDGNQEGVFLLEEDVKAINARIDSFEPEYRPIFLGYMKVEAVEKIFAKDKTKAEKALDAKQDRVNKDAKGKKP